MKQQQIEGLGVTRHRSAALQEGLEFGQQVAAQLAELRLFFATENELGTDRSYE